MDDDDDLAAEFKVEKKALYDNSQNQLPSNLRFDKVEEIDRTDEKLGYSRFTDGSERIGWLVNMHATLRKDPDYSGGRSGIDLYFIQEDGSTFKATFLYEPYFFVVCKAGCEAEVEDFLRKKFKSVLCRTEIVEMLDLSLPNHLSGAKQTAIKLFFKNTNDLQTVKKFLAPVLSNRGKKTDFTESNAAYEVILARVCSESLEKSDFATEFAGHTQKARSSSNILEKIVDLREHDVTYYVRSAIDNDIYVGLWYKVRPPSEGSMSVSVELLKEMVHRADPTIFAFDIETTKLPLKFPDAAFDMIMMISYMVDGQGYLITNREIVSADIEDFEYTPKPEFEGPFIIFNEPNELALLQRFFEHILQIMPAVYVTYNGDFFDWPFIEKRAAVHGISMYGEIGVYRDDQGEYKSTYASHMDCFRWVKRDSYLPVGSQGLKAVTTEKLGYNPMELDPEDMTPYARDHPQTLAQYSVSDAVATFYLYIKYVNPFVFSLCNIIPMKPDDVLRKGSGTLCETLLMVQASKARVLYPNKHVNGGFKFFEGHLLEQETYVGGHVEALRAGVFRADIPIQFELDSDAFSELMNQLPDAVRFYLAVESKINLDDVCDFDEVVNDIKGQLEVLRDSPVCFECPLVYHLDVAAMYPNIILTNRMQPDAVVSEAMCSACDFNGTGADCQRKMEWDWRGEYFPLQKNEFDMLKRQLATERFPGVRADVDPPRLFRDLTAEEQRALLKTRVTDYSRKVHNRLHVSKVVRKEGVVCQRENPFYINTVRLFRDRRYEYKGLLKTWKGKLDAAHTPAQVDEAKKLVVVYDSLQLAHKCILNSFYGYVMRKGSRWHSMEMAAMVCSTGVQIIQMARQLVERIGQPLELDTDGIWCVLPKSFPENFSFALKSGKKVHMSYPCAMLNYLVHARFTNHQYQELAEGDSYTKSSENSIFFEVDGPYKAMILPASTEEDKLLKKRYAVFNDDGSLAELKGFEVKRRGELKLVKIFQSELFKVFLAGDSLKSCYDAVGKVANRWLDVLFSHGKDVSDNDLFDLISENRSMSKSLAEYGNQKSTSICTARRLAEFLGPDMTKDRGLACKFIISNKPNGVPVSERAVPVAIFQAEMSVQLQFLRKWFKDSSLRRVDIRELLDWQYYIDRFGAVIQKLITIPAAMQLVDNPVPRIPHPEWLRKRLRQRNSKMQQKKLNSYFSRASSQAEDIEDVVTVTAVSAFSDVSVAGLPEYKHLWKTDYSGWLRIAKLHWRQSVNQMKQISSMYDLDGSKRQRVMNVTGVSLTDEQSILLRPWQVLQIVETSRPGEMKAWILVDGRSQQVQLTVPRIMYVDLGFGSGDDMPAIPPELYSLLELECGKDGSKFELSICKKTLPRGGYRKYLLRIELEEKIFIRLQRRFQSFFLHKKVAGVFESQTPLLFRAIAGVGSFCIVSKKRAQQRSSMDLCQFTLGDLVLESNVTTSYLASSKTDCSVCFLYHCSDGPLHFIGVFMPDANLIASIVVDPSKQSQEQNLARVYSEQLATLGEQHFVRYPEISSSRFSLHVNVTTALQALAKLIAASATGFTRRAPILALQSDKPLSFFTNQCSQLLEWPCVCVPEHKSDNKFPLDWQRFAGQRFVQRLFQLDVFLDTRRKIAEFARVPLGNIERDASVCVSDILLARKLAREDAVWWCSPSGTAELGFSAGIMSSMHTADRVAPELNNPKGYATASVELLVHGLAVDALLSSHLLEDTSDSALKAEAMQVDESSIYIGDANISAVRSSGNFQVSLSNVSVLKALVKEWHSSSLPISRTLVKQFWRWISSPSSLFYDPGLSSLLFELERKVFVLLAASFEHFGMQLVYGSFSKFVVCTNRRTASRAISHVEFVVRSVLDKAVFRYLDISVGRCWEYLLWLDPFNYGAVQSVESFVDDDEGPLLSGKRRAADSSSVPRVEMLWHIAAYLPVALQSDVDSVFSSYLLRMHGFCRDNDTENVSPTTKRVKGETPGEKFELSEFEQLQRDFVGTTLHRTLLRLVSKFAGPLFASYCELKAAELGVPIRKVSEFPVLPGSHLTMTKPALEFSKTVCRVLSLEKGLEQSARVLKRALLTLLKVSEFSKDAVFVNPCEPLVLPSVVCSFCSLCHDFDLCRDPRFTLREKPWSCTGCGTEHDKLAVEQQLVHSLHKKLHLYQMQDLKCPKCNLCKSDVLSAQCATCAVPYMTVLSSESFKRSLVVFKNISEFYSMKLLSEVTLWILQN